MNKNIEEIFGLIAEFENPNQLVKAAKKIKHEGYDNFDAHSPFPIHGMDKAMGLKDSKLGWIVISFALIGCFGGFSLMIWSSTYAYALNIGGKPFVSIEAFIPVAFELTILFSAFSTVFGMLALNKLPMWYHPIFNSSRFKKVTSSSFFISIEAVDSQYEVDKTRDFLTSIGGKNIEEIKG